MDLLNDSIQIEKKKHILLTINGQTDSQIVRFKYFQKLTCMMDIKIKVEQQFKIQIQSLRLFTQQGVEIFQEDLPYLREGTLLYVSDGVDFDAYSQISVYTIMKVLGEGGFGKVMLGKHKVSGEQVAIKVIDSQKLWNAEDIDLMFREADVMKNLRHQNIIKILNCYTLPNLSVVLIMEFLQGGDLVEYLQEKGQLSEEDARIIFRQIAEGIRYCHDKRLIHRDLKLENILLTSKAEKIIKIIDFGIATVSTNFNIDKIDRGSLSYMAPEIINGQAQEIRSSVDIWALGVILYTLVCGTLPFTNKNDEQTIDNILKCNYQLPINVSKEFKDLLQNMLQPDYNIRYSAYQILRHPWMQKILTQSPTRMLNPRVIGKKVKNGLLKKEITMAGPNRITQQPQLRGGLTMIRSPYEIKYEESPRSSLNFLDSNRSNCEQQQQQDEIIKSPQPISQRKYSDYNQKLIDRIFQDDLKREKIKQFRKNQKQIQNIRSANTSPTSKTANTSPQIQSRVQSPNVYSVRGSSQSSRQKINRQLEIQTIINLSQKFEWKQLFANPIQKINNMKSNPKINEKKSEMLYKLQLQFKERKRKSDQLLIEPGQMMTIQKLCNVIFSARPKRNNY